MAKEKKMKEPKLKKVKQPKEKKAKFKVKKTSFFWIYFVFGAIVIIAALLFAPFWKDISTKIPWAYWSEYALGILMAAAIVVYIIIVLIKKLRQPGLAKIVKIVFGFEFAAMIVLAVLCVLYSCFYGKESKFNFLNACEIVGLIIWIRGFVEVINAYYYNPNAEIKQSYPVWYLLINVAFITFAPIVFTVGIWKKDVVDTYVSYIFSLILVFLGAFLISYGFMAKPIKIKEEPATQPSGYIDGEKEDKKENPSIEDKKDEPPVLEKKEAELENEIPVIENKDSEPIDITEEEKKEEEPVEISVSNEN